MRHLPYLIVSIVIFLFGVAMGHSVFQDYSREYHNEKLKAERYYQMSCVLSDIVRYAVDNGDSSVINFYNDVRYNTHMYNVKFKGEELDTLYWCY